MDVQEAPPIPRRLPFDPPAFDPAKLTVVYLHGAIPLGPQPLAARRYTLTHSDITGQLLLSVGRQYNQGQLSGAAATCHDAREQLMSSTRQTMSQVTGVTLSPIAYSGRPLDRGAAGPRGAGPCPVPLCYTPLACQICLNLSSQRQNSQQLDIRSR